MILELDSDASYLALSKLRSRFAGYFRLLKTHQNPNRSLHSGATLTIRKLIRQVVTSAEEAETTGFFQNTKTEPVIQNLLQHMGHCQPPTIIRTDNSIATGFEKIIYN